MGNVDDSVGSVKFYTIFPIANSIKLSIHVLLI